MTEPAAKPWQPPRAALAAAVTALLVVVGAATWAIAADEEPATQDPCPAAIAAVDQLKPAPNADRDADNARRWYTSAYVVTANPGCFDPASVARARAYISDYDATRLRQPYLLR